MKLTSLFSVNASAQEESLAASCFLQCSAPDGSIEQELSPAARVILSSLRGLSPAWARELAVEVLLSC